MKNIILIGARGSGKTSIGRKIAELTGRKFIDADTEIEHIAGKSIPEIFDEQGENAFRELEKAMREGAISEWKIKKGKSPLTKYLFPGTRIL